MMALHNYHDHYGCFPPAYFADANGRPMHSWRVLLLPYLEEEALYKQYRFDEPCDGPNNRRLHSIRAPWYECASQPFRGTPTTNYVAVVGPTTAWPGARSSCMRDVTDGLSNTVMVVEMADSGIHWMAPRDLDASTLVVSGDPKNGRGISSYHRSERWRQSVVGFHVAVGDGMAYFLPPDAPVEKVRALLTISGGERISCSDLWVDRARSK